MKTLREILLKKHAAAGEQLDQIRAHVVNEIVGQNAARRQVTESQVWPGWADLFWSLRGHFVALAGAWVLIALLSSQTGSDQPVVAAGRGKPAAAELLLIARENRLQMRALLGTADTSETAAPAPRSRSGTEPGAMGPVRFNANC